jgi:uncharacterized Zn-binding protein involved in type VI secretion
MTVCVGPPGTILPPGAATVLIQGMPAACMTAHGGNIIVGYPMVLIG